MRIRSLVGGLIARIPGDISLAEVLIGGLAALLTITALVKCS